MDNSRLHFKRGTLNQKIDGESVAQGREGENKFFWNRNKPNGLIRVDDELGEEDAKH